METAVIGDEIFMIAGEAAELVQRLQRGIAGVLDRFGHAGGLQRQAKAQEIARVRQRYRIDPIALARLHRNQMLALEPQQRLAYRLAAHRITFGELLLAHIIAGCQRTGQDISPQPFIDVIAQKHANFPYVDR